MELPNFRKLCSLCYAKYKLDSLKTTALEQKIEKYLQIEMECNWTGICSDCYKTLEEFHEFYKRIHEAQKVFREKYSFRRAEEKKAMETVEIVGENQSLDRSNKSSTTKASVAVTNESNETKRIMNDCKGGNSVTTHDSMNRKNVSKISDDVCTEIEKKMLEFYNIKCEKCDDFKFTSFKMLSSHYETIHNTQGYIKCCKRNIRVNDKYYLRSHMFKHLYPDTCRCRICGKELSSLATLKHHMILHKPTEERPFECNECDKRFCCKNDLKNHKKAIHMPESEREDFICDVCGKVFQKVANLRYHHSTVHLQEKKYVCEICAKCYTTQSGLRTHINAAHSTLEPIQCNKCHKWLKTKDTFQKHLQLHQNNSYPCNYCEKVCNSSASLRSHLVKHSEKRPYVCTVCRKSFKTKTHLKNHSTQHAGGIHYKCPYCSKLFVNVSNYYTHRRRMHSRESEKNERGNNFVNPESDIHSSSEVNPIGSDDVFANKKEWTNRQNIIVKTFDKKFP